MRYFHPDDCQCQDCMTRAADQRVATAERLDKDAAYQFQLEHYYPEIASRRSRRKNG